MEDLYLKSLNIKSNSFAVHKVVPKYSCNKFSYPQSLVISSITASFFQFNLWRDSSQGLIMQEAAPTWDLTYHLSLDTPSLSNRGTGKQSNSLNLETL